MKDIWVEVKLNDVCQIIAGQSPPSSTYNYDCKGLPFFQGKADFNDIYPSVRVWCNGPLKIAQPNDILLSVRAPVGPTNICQEVSCIGRGLSAIRCNEYIIFWYVFYYFRSIENKLSSSGTGSTFSAITQSEIRNLSILLPPLPEQRAIVAKIEQLFSELDSGVENLKKAQAQLKVYRQAVLKWAFEGKLTEEWRKKQKYLPTAETLLAQIKTEREKQAEKSNKKLKPIAPISKEELAKIPELPEGWCWVKIDVLHKNEKHSVKAGPFGSSLKKEFYVESGYKVYGQEQVIAGDSTIGDYFINEEKYKELESCKIKPNDILISLVGTIGKVLILPENCLPGIINPRLIKINLNTRFYLPIFFKYYFESSFLKNIYKANASGTTMAVLNLRVITELPFTFCSVAEQQQIVQEIEDRLSVCDKMEETIAQSLQKAESLRQSILKKAFEGKLLTTTELEEVRKAPDWEPAEKLLQRIKTVKESEKTRKIK